MMRLWTETPPLHLHPWKNQQSSRLKNIPQKEQKQEQAGFLNIEEPTF